MNIKQINARIAFETQNLWIARGNGTPRATIDELASKLDELHEWRAEMVSERADCREDRELLDEGRRYGDGTWA